ncbi:QWRF motif-containing protein 3 [Tripterygium wilfordii]|uniref:QWRF motif-containing protein 3 n=1 Tax=Tripterygium wilfordii TaxID=458696 RepID=UPI0018F81926|nr:QWRF motif-containing protein 3 [Tripterygium wilfordii]
MFVFPLIHFQTKQTHQNPPNPLFVSVSVSLSDAMKGDSGSVFADGFLKPRKSKSREVSSRFVSPGSSPSMDSGIQPPNQALSPQRRKSTSIDAPNNQRSLEKHGFMRGIWPSSTSRSSDKNNVGTLADHLGNERLKDYVERKKEAKSATDDVFSLSRQRSCSEFNRFENEKESKENHRPSLAGSMRYTGKLRFGAKSSSSSSSSHHPGIVPGRLSVDENALYSRSSRRKPDISMNNLDSESECSDLSSTADCNPAAIDKTRSMSWRKSGIEVSSKYMNDIPTRSRRGSSEEQPVSLDSSPMMKKFTIKNAIKRANSLTGYGGAMSQWALSPGRTGSPPMSVENKARPMSFSSLKPPSSPSKVKGVEKLLNLGLDLFKSKKSSSAGSSPVGAGNVETVHQLRLLHNRLLQWRYANARADAVNVNLNDQVEKNLLNACDSLTKLRHSVLQKNLRLQKEKMEMKLEFILHSQIKPLEAWGAMERQHLSAVSATKECLHSVICRLPLVDGAKADPHLASLALGRASDLTAFIKSTLTPFSPSAEKTVSLLSELAEVAAQEKLLIQELLELFKTMSKLEIQERSLQSFIIQYNSRTQQHQQPHQQELPQQEVQS